MIRVTIEMVPLGFLPARHMATIEIHNDEETSAVTGGSKGTYVAKLSRISQKGEHLGWYDRLVKTPPISRNRSGAVYRILYQALKAHLEEK